MMDQPQQPIPAQQVDAPTEQMAAPVEQAVPAPAADGAAPMEAASPAPEANQEAQDQQIIEEVAQSLADEEITASDIMTAVLSETLGLSPAGAQSLFQLLMSELVDEAETTQQPVVTEDVIVEEQPPTV